MRLIVLAPVPFVRRTIASLSFESGRILPLSSDPSGDVDDAAVSPRRQQVEAERAARCAQLRIDLGKMQDHAASATVRVLEIGSGHGHFLEAYATAHRDHFCLGIDYCAERSRRAARKQQRHVHGNLHFLRAEVWEFLDSMPAELRFDRVFVLFPDPWPKRRHRKYRLISDRFLSRLSACVARGAILCLRTDSDVYFSEAVAVIGNHQKWRIAANASWPFEQPTVFQRKAARYQSVIAISASSATE